MTLKVKPVQIIGNCPASLSLEDEIQIVGMNLETPEGRAVCFLALSQIPLQTWQLQSGARFFAHASCPGCTSRLEEENRVVFLLGHADKWTLCQRISEYLLLSKQVSESDEAIQLKNAAIQHQNQGEFTEAAQKMASALEILNGEAQ